MKERKEVSSGGEPGRSGGGGFSHVFLVEEVIGGVTPIIPTSINEKDTRVRDLIVWQFIEIERKIPDRDLTQFWEILFIVDFGSSRH